MREIRSLWMAATAVVVGFGALASTALVPDLRFDAATGNATGTSPASVAAVGLAAANAGSPGMSNQMVAEKMAAMPLSFTKNEGQWDERVLFRADAGRATMWFADDGAYYQFSRRVPYRADRPGREQLEASRGGQHTPSERPREAPDSLECLVIKASFVGANPNPRLVGDELHERQSNYFLGNDPSKWRTGVPNYDAVVYSGIYSGIDLKYYGNGTQMEYDFIVSPGADPSQIAVRYDGAKSVTVNGAGELAVETDWGTVTERTLTVYQIDGNRRIPLHGEYVLCGDDCFGFQVEGGYNPELALVIDPVLAYSTYLAGGAHDRGYDIAVDGSGNAYVTGFTSSSDFPIVSAYQSALSGGFDAFVTKLNSAGSPVGMYSTYLGGSGNDYGDGIAVDGSGNAYVTGYTGSATFPCISAYQPTFGGGYWDAFVTKLNSAGSPVGMYSTYLGGAASDQGNDIAVDGSGNAYVIGQTGSTNFKCISAYQSTYGGGVWDAFVTKFNSAGSPVGMYSTYLGGAASDQGNGIAVDGSGNAYVTGQTFSTNFPTTINACRPVFAGGISDAFVTKLNSAGSPAGMYSTYLGGGGYDIGNGIALDGSGNAYVTGQAGAGFPTTVGAYQPTSAGDDDGFVTKLDPAGSPGGINDLEYSTYLGGSAKDWSNDIAVDGSGNAYVTGATFSTDFPTTPNTYQPASGGYYDAFVTKLNSAGSPVGMYSTYLGGGGYDFGNGVAVGGDGCAYVTGNTSSSNVPPGDDAFVTKMCDCVQPPPDMVNWWTLDEQTGSFAHDQALLNNIGTHQNGPTPIPAGVGPGFGRVYGALRFDGIDDYVNVPHHYELDLCCDFTIDAWIRIDNPSGTRPIVDKRTVDPVGYTLYLKNNRLGFQMADAAGFSNYETSARTWNPNDWYHVAVTVERSGIGVLYVDGAVVLTFTPRTGILNNPAAFWIGRHHSNIGWPFDEYWDGDIDEVEMFHRALTDLEIQSIIDAGSLGKCRRPVGNIAGVKFNDGNKNGSWDSNWELGMPGVTITVTMQDLQPPGGASIVTNANGIYFFEHLPVGFYDVSEAVPASYVATTPVTQPVEVLAALTRIGPDFGNVWDGSCPVDTIIRTRLVRIATPAALNSGNVDVAVWWGGELEMGGFDFLISYDHTALTFQGVSRGTLLDSLEWEYFTYRIGAGGNCPGGCPDGLIRLVAIADLDNGPQQHPIVSSAPGVLAYLRFRVSGDRNLIGQCAPIRFYWADCGDNTFASVSGNTTYLDRRISDPLGSALWDEDDDVQFPESARPQGLGAPDSCLRGGGPDKPTPIRGLCFRNGWVCIIEPPDDRGDINLNGIANEVADAVLFSNVFIYGVEETFPIEILRPGQILATDINDDGIVLTIADLVYLIRIITGDASPFPPGGNPKLTPYQRSANAIVNVGSDRVTVTANSTADLGGAVFTFRYSGLTVGDAVLSNAASQMVVKSKADRGELRVLVAPMMNVKGARISTGINEILSIPTSGNGTIELTNVEMSDAQGALLSTSFSKSVPAEYALLQNYPNPFNAGTIIPFGLKETTDWTLNVYNVTGQTVRSFSGNGQGQVQIAWDGTDNHGRPIASGVYFYRLETKAFTATKKMTLMK